MEKLTFKALADPRYPVHASAAKTATHFKGGKGTKRLGTTHERAEF